MINPAEAHVNSPEGRNAVFFVFVSGRECRTGELKSMGNVLYNSAINKKDGVSMPGKKDRWLTGICVILAVLMVYILIMLGLGYSLMDHSPYDSYTLQAMAWREGRMTVDGPSYTWLELAIYQDEYYVSFPPVPSVVMLPLTWIWGYNTPTMAVNLFMLLCTAAFGYALLLRLGHHPVRAAVVAFFYVCGCNILIIMLRGGVWYTAQGMSMLLTAAFLYGVNSPKEKHNRAAMSLGLVCLALSVGCRPFQAVYVPYGLYKLYMWKHREGEKWIRTILGMVPYVIAPLMIAAAYGWYNTVRFDNPLEFGHNYLPEFTREGNTQFSLAHWPKNLKNIFRMPQIVNGVLTFDRLGPTALPLTCPIFVISMIETIRRLIRKKLDWEDVLLIASLFIHFNLLLLHRTLGGMQLGVRYMDDLVPALLLLTFRKKEKLSYIDVMLMLLGVGVNIYGAIVF